MKPGRKPKGDRHVELVRAALTGDYSAFETPSQAYAMRVWSGQSVDVPPAERKERVFAALRGQNLSTDGIVFPK
jgi:hypothetical protein